MIERVCSRVSRSISQYKRSYCIGVEGFESCWESNYQVDVVLWWQYWECYYVMYLIQWKVCDVLIDPTF